MEIKYNIQLGIRQNKIKENEKSKIYIRFYYKREYKYFPTKIFLFPNEWDKKGEIVLKKCLNHKIYNSYLKKTIIKFQEREFEALQYRNFKTFEELFDFIIGKSDEKTKVVDFIRSEVDSNKSYAKNTIKGYNTVLMHLMDYNKSAQLKEIDYKFIVGFNNYLYEKGLAVNSIAKQHANLRAMINIAIKEKKMNYNPYKDFKVKTEESKRVALEIDELQRIEELDIDGYNPHLKYAWDLFLFSCYTGLRFEDVMSLTKDDIIEIGEECYIEKKIIKTKRILPVLPLHILFNGKPLKILKKYYNANNKTIFKEITNQQINRLLKLIAMMAKVDKRLTYHIARHTCTTNIAHLTGDVHMVKEILGHDDIRTSMIYITMSKERIKKKLLNVKWELK